MATNKNKHLTQDDRNVIAIGIVNGSSKKAIADNLGKDKSTIGKEIRAHRYLSHKSTLSLECENYAHCKFTFQLRRLARIEWERLLPDKGPLPVIAQTFDIPFTSFRTIL